MLWKLRRSMHSEETTFRGYSGALRTLNVELLLIAPTGRTFVKHAPFLTGSYKLLRLTPLH